jgi:hypothetical protein
MTKDEMKNRISMALKDPILQQGFECICKENAELKSDLDKKENTVHTLDVLHKEAVRKYGEVNDQLTKAKEIIEGLMRFCRCFAQHHTEDIRYKEAEQFLKEE